MPNILSCKLFFISLAIAASGASAQLTTVDAKKCSAIADSSARLACFDGVGKTPKKVQKSLSKTQQAELDKQKIEDERRAKAELDEKAKVERELAEKKEQEEKAKIEKEKAELEAERQKVIAVAKEALRGLKKFENRVETGISYRDYASVFSDAKFDVKSFVDGPHAAKLPEFAEFCRTAMDNYTDAHVVWKQKIDDSDRYSTDTIYRNQRLIEYITDKYPLAASVRQGKSMPGSMVMQIVWREASANIGRAEAALQKFSLP